MLRAPGSALYPLLAFEVKRPGTHRSARPWFTNVALVVVDQPLCERLPFGDRLAVLLGMRQPRSLEHDERDARVGAAGLRIRIDSEILGELVRALADDPH